MLMKRMQHINRYREIVTVLAKHGFGYIMKEVGLFHMLSLPKRMAADLNSNEPKPLGKRLRLVMEELGPTFIKLGQLLSIRRDIIPEQLAIELENLQDKVTPVNSLIIKQTIKEELGASCEEIFEHFENQSLAAASIGQVHKAILKSGETVVVKVRRPNIETQVDSDIEILRDIARLVEHRYDWAKQYQIRDIIDELAQAIKSEMDYTQEGRNAEKISRQFENDDNILIPAVFWDYSTKKVLTTEYIDGKKYAALNDDGDEHWNKKIIAERIVHSFLNQVLMGGVYHGDPHPGNLLFLPENKIAYIDFGQIGVLSDEMKKNFASLIIGLMKKDTDILIRTISRMAITSEDIKEGKLRQDLDDLREKYYNIPLSKIKIGESITDLFNVTQRHRIMIPKDYTLLGKALITVEGMVKNLDPELSLIHLAEPFGKKLILERFHPVRAATKLWEELTDFANVTFRLPGLLRKTLMKINKGQVRLEMELPQIDKLLLKLDRVGNRIAFSVTLLAFSIIITGLIISQTFSNRVFFHFPAVGIGIGIAILMFVWLLFSIFRSGRF
ncbi:AarF/UbiB family protein [Fictibacillus sp. Mic-4]|uniref:ABC1 kinase family protein n=1 Tax=Fictibacillus TaxID=1329200 RepID=UPI00040C6285|nr:AarF/UbiB family protein [Fictibacillus gelatini]